MDLLPLFEQAARHTAALIDGVDESQYGDPTPCSEWDVRALIGHLVGTTTFFGAALNGQPPPAGAGDDAAGGDPGAAYREAVAAILTAYEDAASLEESFDTPAGPLTGAQLIPIFLTEAVWHGWDLAVATGQDSTIDDELGAAALAIAEQSAEIGRAAGVYGPPVEVPEDASAAIKALALVGRRA